MHNTHLFVFFNRTVIGFIVTLVIFATVFEAITVYHEKQRKCSSTNGKVPMTGHTNLGMVLDVKTDNHVNGNGVAHESLNGEITNNYKIHTERVASVPHLAQKPNSMDSFQYILYLFSFI